MLIVGAKGFAKEVLEILHQNSDIKNLAFYDDVNPEHQDLLYGKFPVITTLENAENYLKTEDNRFALGIGKPDLREKLIVKFSKLGGKLCSTISRKADIGSYGVEIEDGANILDGVKISNDVKIGLASLIYYNSIITHDVEIGNFVEISPDVKILGRAKIGNYCQLGSGSIILPDITVGDRVIVGAGAVVTKNIPDNCTVAGIPARITKKND